LPSLSRLVVHRICEPTPIVGVLNMVGAGVVVVGPIAISLPWSNAGLRFQEMVVSVGRTVFMMVGQSRPRAARFLAVANAKHGKSPKTYSVHGRLFNVIESQARCVNLSLQYPEHHYLDSRTGDSNARL
jgi:hypothetical protein